MDEFDERVVSGLRELVDRAPDDTDVWAETERHIARHRRRRRTIGLAAVVVALASTAAVAGAMSTRSHGSARVSATTPTTSDSTLPNVNVCPAGCVGQTAADVDGDGRPDKIGLVATPPLSGEISAGKPSKLVIRVAFASGRVSEYDDTAEWDASLLGASDVNSDGKAEIFYFNNTGANLHSGHILRWDGSRLVAVQSADGKPFETFTSGYAMGGDGFRCTDNAFVTMTISYGTPPDGWTASRTTYQWNGNQLVKVTENQPMPLTPPPAGSPTDVPPSEYDQIIGAHCPGLQATYPDLTSPSTP